MIKTIQEKTINKFLLNLYFVGTFQMGVTILFPIIEKIMNNSYIPNINKEQIVLLAIFSITQVLSLANSDIKEKNEKLKNLISLSFISRSFLKIIDVFTDMFAYVSLCVPVAIAIIEIVSKDGLNPATLPQKIYTFAGGAALYAFKSFIETITIMIKNKNK
jgi:hypothetical protein